jgi:hypothetical protein
VAADLTPHKDKLKAISLSMCCSEWAADLFPSNAKLKGIAHAIYSGGVADLLPYENQLVENNISFNL